MIANKPAYYTYATSTVYNKPARSHSSHHKSRNYYDDGDRGWNDGKAFYSKFEPIQISTNFSPKYHTIESSRSPLRNYKYDYDSPTRGVERSVPIKMIESPTRGFGGGFGGGQFHTIDNGRGYREMEVAPRRSRHERTLPSAGWRDAERHRGFSGDREIGRGGGRWAEDDGGWDRRKFEEHRHRRRHEYDDGRRRPEENRQHERSFSHDRFHQDGGRPWRFTDDAPPPRQQRANGHLHTEHEKIAPPPLQKEKSQERIDLHHSKTSLRDAERQQHSARSSQNRLDVHHNGASKHLSDATKHLNELEQERYNRENHHYKDENRLDVHHNGASKHLSDATKHLNELEQERYNRENHHYKDEVQHYRGQEEVKASALSASSEAEHRRSAQQHIYESPPEDNNTLVRNIRIPTPTPLALVPTLRETETFVEQAPRVEMRNKERGKVFGKVEPKDTKDKKDVKSKETKEIKKEKVVEEEKAKAVTVGKDDKENKKKEKEEQKKKAKEDKEREKEEKKKEKEAKKKEKAPKEDKKSKKGATAVVDAQKTSEIIFKEASAAQMALNLLRSSSSADTSFAVSPASLGIGLTMLCQGAEGDTKQELAHFLLPGCSEDSVLLWYSDLAKALSAKSPIDIKTVNKIYKNKTVKLNKTNCNSVINKHFKTKIEDVDVTKQPGKAAEKINKLVSKSTKGAVDRVVTESDLHGLGLLVIDAVHCNPTFLYPFEKKNSEQQTFFGAREDRPVLMLKAVTDGKKLSYAQYDDVQVLQLPYKNPAYRLVLFVPRYNLKAFRESLSGSRILQLIKESNETTELATVCLPHFKIDSEIGNEEVKSCGVRTAFTDSNEFPGIAEKLFVTLLRHRAVIEATDTGKEDKKAKNKKDEKQKSTEKAPAEGELKHEFIVNRPFLYAVVKDDLILFLGQYA